MEKILEILENINAVIMDSRDIKKNDLFLAINNGNQHIGEALENGAKYVIADEPGSYESDARVIKVPNTISMIQNLAYSYVKKLKEEGLKIIAITGSNGKTTTKDFINAVLSQKLECLATLGNYNNHIGVPFMLLNLKRKHKVAIIEMGMSNFGEIDQLAKIAQPDFGIITNIGDSHLEFLKNRENVFKAKTELFKYISSENQIVYGEDPFLKKLKATKIILENFSDGLDGASFRIFGEEYKIKLNGEYNAINAAMAVVIGKRFGLTPQEIKKGLNEAIITHMRFEKIDRENRLFINDAYNASPISMKKSLKTFSEVYKNNKNIAVLGDMLELGENEIDFHKNVLLEALKLNIEKIYLYGPRMKKAADLIQNDKLKCFENKEEIKSLLLEEKEKVNIFLKGSRGMRIEEVIA